MKKNIMFMLVTLAVFGIGASLISSMDTKGLPVSQLTGGREVLALTKSVDVPEDVTFAGEKTVLDRYDLHERYDREINDFTYYHSSTLLLIKRANRIFPIIEPILKKNGLPDDLKYLAVIESMLDPRAVSPAKAAGLWQFMPTTAKQYGLKVTEEVDERFSIEKSTEAACQYLKKSYAKYRNWANVAQSYNAGTARISGEMENQKENNGLDLLLNNETSRYYFRMLAIKNIFANPSNYGFILSANELYKQIDFRKIEVKESIPSLVDFAKGQGITYAQLKDFNPWLRDRQLTINPNDSNRTYTILIPTQESLYYHRGAKIKVHNSKWVVQE